MHLEPYESYLSLIGLAITIFIVSFSIGYLMNFIANFLNKKQKN
jgi:hypothetical protein